MQSYEVMSSLSGNNKTLVLKDGELIVAYGEKESENPGNTQIPAYFIPVKDILDAIKGESIEPTAVRYWIYGWEILPKNGNPVLYLTDADMVTIEGIGAQKGN